MSCKKRSGKERRIVVDSVDIGEKINIGNAVVVSMNVNKMEARDDWSGGLSLYALLFGVPLLMFFGGKVLLAFCKACRRGAQKTALIGLSRR